MAKRMTEESIYTKFKRLMDQIRDIFAAAFRKLRTIIKAVVTFAKKTQRVMVRYMTYSPNQQHAAAARVWLRTKNRRIRRKHWKILFPAIMELTKQSGDRIGEEAVTHIQRVKAPEGRRGHWEDE